MLELSLHVLDIVNNSIKANAETVKIEIDEQIKKNLLTISIEDDGYGMDEEFLRNVKDPFRTTRTTRKVGMGLSLFEAAAVATGGWLKIESEKNVGTKVVATFTHDHIDRQPIGDMAQTILTLISGNESVDFLYHHIKDDKEFIFDTKEIKKILGDISFNNPEITLWLSEYIKEGLDGINA